jgi:hypothetical protein
VPLNFARSRLASFASSSSAVTCGARERNIAVVSPGPGPISSRLSPSFASPSAHGTRSSSVFRQCSVPQNQ